MGGFLIPSYTLHTHLFVSPHQVCPGVAGVIDHHLLLPQTVVRVTATRDAAGAALFVVMKKYYSERGAKDVKGHSDEDKRGVQT